jgi:hypothetical protein
MRCLSATQQVFIRASHTLQVQGDGEVIGQTPVEVTVAPGAVQVLTPQAQKTEQADIGPGTGLGASFFQGRQKR